MKILLIEDEKELADAISKYLHQEKYLCEMARTFNDAIEKINLYQYDCILVDITLPDGNGLKVISELKQMNSEAGIIIISAKNALDDKINGLETGADDYLTKPFHLPELNARIKSVIRRRNFGGNRETLFQEIRIRPDEMEVYINDQPLILTRKEFELLLFFVSNKERVLTKESIAEHLWGDSMDLADSYDFIYTHIKNLRKKIIEGGGADYIRTVYGMGYKFSAQ